ncbi:MAG: hypothetical protein QXY45_02405 [Candidatus Aenigmatarchaeota archaeon]
MFMEKWFVSFILIFVLILSGCVEQRMEIKPTVAETTTKYFTTTETSIPIETTAVNTPVSSLQKTTTTISKRCRFLNFQIKSHAYRNGKLKFYFENIGSEEINDFEVRLQFTNTTLVERYTDQEIQYHTVRVYEMDVGPGLENVTFVEISCGKKYFIKV